MVAYALLLIFLLIAAATDLRKQSIYNWTTYPGMLAGVLVNALGQGSLGQGWDAIQSSIAGFTICGSVMLLCYVLFPMGGGDVKLMAMIGAFLGPYRGIEALLWTFVLGSIMAVAYLIWTTGIIKMIGGIGHHLVLVFRSKGWVPLTKTEREPLQRGLFLAPAGFVAVCIVVGRYIDFAI